MLDAEEQKPDEAPNGPISVRPIEPGTVQVDRGNEADISPPRGNPFPIVGIGGSAGALEGFTSLLKALPDDTGMAFVFVQHLDPRHGSQLPEILATSTQMPVHTVEDGMRVQPNEIFVIPPNATLRLEGGVLRLASRNPGLHLPVDAFFESLAQVQGSRAIGIVLSGNASDGSQGVRAIKGECGLTFAQNEETAQHVGMPRNAIATGAVDYVLPPVEIARELVHLSHHAFVRPPQPSRPQEESLPEGDGDLRRVLNILKNRTKVDFSHYKQKTILRRIGRRMIVKRAKTLGAYARMIEDSPEEVRELYRDLLISVTNFFRDPEVFGALAGLLRDMLLSRTPTEPFRAWVPGCATGEEVYSLAILLQELIDDLNLATPLQLFGTDISDVALERARAADYPDFIAQNVSAERLRRFFVRGDHGYQIRKPLREVCVFARQDVTTDPPFGHMDLISCRNLLIYLDGQVQRKILPIFHYSLNPTGLLLLGTAESIAEASDLFSVVSKQHRIYARKPAPMRLTINLAADVSNDKEKPVAAETSMALGGIELQRKVDLVIQSKYSPPSVVIDSEYQILHFRGRTGFYLEPSAGEATFHLLRMVREPLVRPIQRAIQAATARNLSVREAGGTVEHLGERREVAVEVTPIPGEAPLERYFLIVFEDVSIRASAAAPATDGQPAAQRPEFVQTLETHAHELEEQVAGLHERLRNANEDHEAHLEELKAANEEIRSANEELQSTNEELNTTKEELQSANEELSTLNEELQNRNNELNVVNSDLVNLLAAVDVAFLMVDRDLRLRRFSEAAERILGVKPMDMGYPLTHLQGRVDLSVLYGPMRSAVETLHIDKRELQDKNGQWFAVTIRPYRTLDDRIAGAVIVFVDIDPLKRMLRAAEQARDYAEGMVATVREPLVVLDRDLRIQRATSAFYDTFRVSRSETEGRLLYDLGSGQWNIPKLRELLGEALFRDHPFQDFEVEHEFPHIGRRTMRLNARRIAARDGESPTALLAIEDVTKRRQEAEIRYQRLFQSAKDGMLVFDAETEKLTDVNPYFLELTGASRERVVGKRVEEIESFATADGSRSIVRDAREQEVVRRDAVCLLKGDGTQIEVEMVANRYAVGGQQVIQVNVRDVTWRNRAVRELRDREERFRLLVDSLRDYALFQMDVNGRIVSWNSGADRLLGYTEAEILGKPASVLFTPEDVAAGEPEKELEGARTSGRSEDERWHMRKDGSRFFASGVLTMVCDEAGELRGFAKVMRDVTERREAEEKLRQQAQLLDLAQDLIIVQNLDGTIAWMNRAAEQSYGWSNEEARGKTAYTLFQTVFPEARENIESKLHNGGRWEGQLVHTRRDGSKMAVWSRWALQLRSGEAPEYVLEINRDITDIHRTEEQLRASLGEKEVLLKEIHHRVKNNLQVVASLLNLQAVYVQDANARLVLEEMHMRVRTIGAIHELLYRADDLSRIEFTKYLETLAADLASIYAGRASGVRVVVESGPLALDITQAVPCGLIVNELLTNSFKHAFPDKRSGVITVRFGNVGDQCVLEVSDNGAGLPESADLQNSKSMGFQVVILLVRQIKGTIEVDRSEGTRFRIKFPQKVS